MSLFNISRPSIRLLAPCAALALTLLAGALRRADAQGDVVPAEVTALFNDLADIDKMRVLGPLKLKPEQIDRLIATIKKSQDAYNKALVSAAVPPIKELAQEIKETRRKVIAGATIPSNFDKKVKKIQDDFVERRDKAEYDALKGLSDSIRAILTPSQVEKAVSLAKDFSAQGGRTPKGTDDQFFNLYVKGTFIVYAGITNLLQDMRKAADSARLDRAGKPADRVARLGTRLDAGRTPRPGRAAPPKSEAQR